MIRRSSAVAGLLLAHAACSSLQEGLPSATASPQDAELRRSAEQVLAREPQLSISARNVAVTVRNHVVSLRGSVATRREKDLVEAAVRTLPTVTRVSNAIEVAPQRDRDDAESDGTIAQAIRETIASDPRFAPTARSLCIVARHGVVKLDGWAADQDVERGVEKVAEETPGVIAVECDLTIALRR
jgi:osmotically-inducible protein OsmY